MPHAAHKMKKTHILTNVNGYMANNEDLMVNSCTKSSQNLVAFSYPFSKCI